VSKYREAIELFNEMISQEPNKRPDCAEILNDKRLWALTGREFDVQKEFENSLSLTQNEQLFVYEILMIRTSFAF
jgi:hypothetical protein